MLHQFGLEETTSKAVCVGDKFGRLTVKATGRVPGTWRYKAICQCECGSPLFAAHFHVLTEHKTQSCGCLQRERSTRHGLYKSPHYARWRGMMARCYDQSHSSYERYGGRGIKVCDRWHDLETFVAELPDGYTKGAQLDRIDNDGDYEPGNVQWLHRKANSGKRRDSHDLVTYDGRTQSVARWAEETGIDQATLTNRIFHAGWPVAEALGTPPGETTRMLTHEGRTQSITAWANEKGIPRGTLGHRIKQGWPVDQALNAPKNAEVFQRAGAKRYPFDGGEYTIREISQITRIADTLLRKRLKRGWTIDKATRDRTDQ